MLEAVRKKGRGDRGRPRLGHRGFLGCIEDVETLDLAARALLEGADEPPGLARLALAGIGDGVALDLAQATGGRRTTVREVAGGGVEVCRTDHLSQAVRVRGRLRWGETS